VRKGGVNGVR
jgi:hypothetical protein